MRSTFLQYIESHEGAVRDLRTCLPMVDVAASLLVAQLSAGFKVLVCGNGGSAADAQHIAAELVGRFKNTRRGLPALALTTDTSVLTAIGNDFDFSHLFSRQVEALAVPGDVLLGISTSGTSANVLAAVRSAREAGCHTIGLLGRNGGRIAPEVSVSVVVPSQDTPHIQECHILVGHYWCDFIDTAFSERTE